jgi:hypothetical protein
MTSPFWIPYQRLLGHIVLRAAGSWKAYHCSDQASGQDFRTVERPGLSSPFLASQLHLLYIETRLLAVERQSAATLSLRHSAV